MNESEKYDVLAQTLSQTSRFMKVQFANTLKEHQ